METWKEPLGSFSNSFWIKDIFLLPQLVKPPHTETEKDKKAEKSKKKKQLLVTLLKLNSDQIKYRIPATKTVNKHKTTALKQV